FRHQTFAVNALPERAADCAGVSPTVEDCADNLYLARAGVPVLADIAVEPHCAIVPSFGHSLAIEEMNRQDGGVAAVAPAERQYAAFQIGEATEHARACRQRP